MAVLLADSCAAGRAQRLWSSRIQGHVSKVPSGAAGAVALAQTQAISYGGTGVARADGTAITPGAVALGTTYASGTGK